MSPTFYWLASYPKSGNTWLRVFLTNLKSGAKLPAYINEIETEGISSGREWLDDILGTSTADLTAQEVLLLRPHIYRWSSLASTKTSHIKAHDANFEVANNQYLYPAAATAGVIYIIRNPLDVAISLAHHSSISIDKAIKRMSDPNNKLSRFTGKSQTIQVEQHLFSWSRHVESWVDHEGFDTLVIRYEDMQATPHETFACAADYLGITFDSATLDQAIKNSSFDVLSAQENKTAFKERPPKARSFFREGKVGQWRNILTECQIEHTISSHGVIMRRFGYLDENNKPKDT